MRAKLLMVLTLLAVLLSTGCDEPWEDDYDFVRYGALVTVYGYGFDEGDAYPSSFQLLDQHTASVMAFLGIESPSDYTYRWITEEMVDEYCWGAPACTSYGVARSSQLPQMHETNHMVLATSVGQCHVVLEEGIAQYLGESLPNWALSTAPEFGIDALLEPTNWQYDDRAYHRAGHFIAFLAERYGGQAIADLCRAVPPTSKRREWELAAPLVLGISLAELLAEYAEYPECTVNQFRARLWECGGEPDFVLDGVDFAEFSFEFEDDDERVITSGTNPKKAVISRRVLFEHDAWVLVDVTVDGRHADKRGHFGSQECVPCSADPRVVDDRTLEPSNPPVYGLEYRAGMHEILLTLDEGEGDSIQLHMSAGS